MTIAEAREKCNALVGKIPRDALIIGVLLITSIISFGLGFLAGSDAGQQGSNTRETAPLSASPDPTSPPQKNGEASTGRFVASKNGTKYYLPTCSGASRISEANKVWFTSAAAATAAGYSPAANCDGM